MSLKIHAKEKRYPRETGYQPDKSNTSIELSDFDRWAVSQRIKQENRSWLFKQVAGAIVGILIGLFIIGALNR